MFLEVLDAEPSTYGACAAYLRILLWVGCFLTKLPTRFSLIHATDPPVAF